MASAGVLEVQMAPVSIAGTVFGHQVAHRDMVPQNRVQQLKRFSVSAYLMGAVILGLLLGFANYVHVPDYSEEDVDRFYMWFIHVQIMVYIGFGFLMTFLKHYSCSAVCFNFFLSAMMFLEAILCIGACHQVFWNAKQDHIEVEIALLIECSFCAASGMIAFGAVIGKTTPAQIMWLMVMQVPIYALNQRLVIYEWKILDMGGTFVIHLFGAYYGLAASWMISRRQPMHGLGHPKLNPGYYNDVFSMIGTIFLFIYWPSFNGALASMSSETRIDNPTAGQINAQFLSVINTVISLSACVVSTFATSALVNGRISMVHIQNSTIAGGVAMGAACTLRMTPGGSVAVGLAAGILSVVGFQYVMPFLDRTIGLGDTCGVHNLHGLPSILGGLVAGLAALGQTEDYLPWGDGATQLGYQVLAIVTTMAIAIGAGLVAGYLVSLLDSGCPLSVEDYFEDQPWWDIHTAVLPDKAASIHLKGNSNHGKAVNTSAHGGLNTSMHGSVAFAGSSVGGGSSHFGMQGSLHGGPHVNTSHHGGKPRPSGTPYGYPASMPEGSAV
mmetsp:Transcript_3351/g.7324  ORF Transcript_3351/g.7324 Transcript_3351/m.7324 type:complete len:554 (-) Transcript_3351:542-2203(-)